MTAEKLRPLSPYIFAIAFFLIWELGTWAFNVSVYVLPRPSQFFSTLFDGALPIVVDPLPRPVDLTPLLQIKEFGKFLFRLGDAIGISAMDGICSIQRKNVVRIAYVVLTTHVGIPGDLPGIFVLVV